MHISTDILKAFITVHSHGGFTSAAKELSLTQSALSQKIAKLEDLLESKVFIRGKKTIELTQSGKRLLPFAIEQLEHELTFLDQFQSKSNELSGVIRLGGFSSIMSSAMIPTLSSLMIDNPKSNIEFSSFDMEELEVELFTHRVDMIVTDYLPHSTGLVTSEIGKEEYVLIESKEGSNRSRHFLDHGIHDNATESFLRFQGDGSDYTRGFMGDVFGIISAVEQGLGVAVMSKHMLKNNRSVKIKRSSKRYFRTLYLSYIKRNYYPPLFKEVERALKQKTKNYL